ncbi:MAG: hypothetical protein ACLFTK_08265 [Anaerolineales bacterium]
MYIRWIVRGHRNSEAADVSFHDAYLVESFRDTSGEPRQNTLAYLGNIRQIGDSFPGIERELFLLRAEFIMGSMPEISEEDRRQVMGQLHQKVPPLDNKEAIIGFQNTLRWFFRFWRDNGGGPGEAELIRMVKDARDNPDSIYLTGDEPD